MLTYLLFVRLRKAGAWPSSARACSDREALKAKALPPDTTVVIRAALTIDGNTEIFMRCMAITLAMLASAWKLPAVYILRR